MTIATWKKEFYSAISKVSEKNALAHSLKKWEGLTKENLTKHGVFACEGHLHENGHEGNAFIINCTTCALCRWNSDNKKRGWSCHACPIRYMTGSGCHHEFNTWCDEHNPAPMLRLLEKTIKLVDTQMKS